MASPSIPWRWAGTEVFTAQPDPPAPVPWADRIQTRSSRLRRRSCRSTAPPSISADWSAASNSREDQAPHLPEPAGSIRPAAAVPRASASRRLPLLLARFLDFIQRGIHPLQQLMQAHRLIGMDAGAHARRKNDGLNYRRLHPRQAGAHSLPTRACSRRTSAPRPDLRRAPHRAPCSTRCTRPHPAGARRTRPSAHRNARHPGARRVRAWSGPGSCVFRAASGSSTTFPGCGCSPSPVPFIGTDRCTQLGDIAKNYPPMRASPADGMQPASASGSRCGTSTGAIDFRICTGSAEVKR